MVVYEVFALEVLILTFPKMSCDIYKVGGTPSLYNSAV